MNSVAYSIVDVLRGPKEVKQKPLRDVTPTSVTMRGDTEIVIINISV